jgi:hypothetical protein
MNCKYCVKKAIKKGLCQTHYMRLYRHGDPLVVNKKGYQPKNRICIISDCDRKHYGKGLCFMHYMRNRRHNDPLTTNKRGRKLKIIKE